MTAPVLAPRVLVCPNGCGTVAPDLVAGEVPVGSGAARLHDCPVMFGLAVPLVPQGTRAEARLAEREDYVGGEVGIRYAEGRAVMGVSVERDDGNDVVVYAPTARGGFQA